MESTKPTNTAGFDPWHQGKRCQAQGGPIDPEVYVSPDPSPGCFPLVDGQTAAPLVVSEADYAGVIRAAADLQTDIQRVTQTQPVLATGEMPPAHEIVLIGTIDKSPLIGQLVQRGKLDVSGLAGRWETFALQVVEEPLPGIRRALVIAGSDRRGTIYGIYDLSAQIGVSPWHFWADVPAARREALYILPGRYTQGEPAVKYRGFFINDENPALGTWAPGCFGSAPNPDNPQGFNHHFYAKVFEVLLRLKGNYLWPAVWGRSMFDDDPDTQKLADEYGVVIGTSHEAPMMRAQDEWRRYGRADGPYGGNGSYSFRANAEALKAYWADSIRRMGACESVVTIGMRGDGDTELEDGFAMELMQGIVAAQREILTAVTGREAAEIPQVWVLYKEVQRYWEEGMAAPDDATLMWCDDNWGNIRKLPDSRAPERRGGHGLYYHFDYVGGARNYKWVDTNLLPNIWEQLHLAYRYGVDRIWVVNVGDLKSEELPLHFFLDYAWNPERWPIERLPEWEERWARQQFGPEQAPAIARLLAAYADLQSLRKPELLNRKTVLNPEARLELEPEAAVVHTDGCPFSLTDYREMERIVAAWQQLAAQAEEIRQTLPPAAQDAYYELAYYAIKAGALLYELRLAGFRNRLYHEQGRAATNDLAALAEEKFAAGRALADYFNHTLAGGKWQGFQTQAYLGYGGPYPNSSWQQPELDNVPLPDFIWPPLLHLEVPDRAEMGVAVDGSEAAWPQARTKAVLPIFSPYQRQTAQYIEVFNRGTAPFAYRIDSPVPWLAAEPCQGVVEKEVRATVHVDWSRAPKGNSRVPLTVYGPDESQVIIEAVVDRPEADGLQDFHGFIESNGYVSMAAEHYARAVETSSCRWKRLPRIGRTVSGMTPFPVTAPRQVPGGEAPHLDYSLHLFSGGAVTVWVYLSPRNNVLPTDGLMYAVSFDEAEPQTVNVTAALNAIPMNKSWERNTSDNVCLTSSVHQVEAGAHVLRFWMVDPTVILQKIVIDTGGLKPSYLGPPESLRMGANLP